MSAVNGAVLSLLRDAYQRRDKVGLARAAVRGLARATCPAARLAADLHCACSLPILHRLGGNFRRSGLPGVLGGRWRVTQNPTAAGKSGASNRGQRQGVRTAMPGEQPVVTASLRVSRAICASEVAHDHVAGTRAV